MTTPTRPAAEPGPDIAKMLAEIDNSIGDLCGLISTAQYNADELQQGIAAWEPVADTMHDGTMAMIREEIRAAQAAIAAAVAQARTAQRDADCKEFGKMQAEILEMVRTIREGSPLIWCQPQGHKYDQTKPQMAAFAEGTRMTIQDEALKLADKLYARHGRGSVEHDAADLLRRLSSPSAGAQDAELRAFGASDAACYKWPGDTELDRACRAAYIEGAASTAVQGGEAGEVAELIDRLRIINRYDEIDGIVASCKEAALALTSTAEKAKQVPSRSTALTMKSLCNQMDEYKELARSTAEKLAKAEADLADEERESKHYLRLAFVDAGANPPVTWKERAEQVEAREARLRAALEAIKLRAAGLLSYGDWFEVHNECEAALTAPAQAAQQEDSDAP